ALVDDLEAGVPGPHRDLLGAVGVPVEAGLADEDAQLLAELLPRLRDPLAHGRELAAPGIGDADRAGHAGRRPELAEDLAQRLGPLPDRHAGAGALEGGLEEVVLGPGDLLQPGDGVGGGCSG